MKPLTLLDTLEMQSLEYLLQPAYLQLLLQRGEEEQDQKIDGERTHNYDFLSFSL
jgi:hypothetical protein